MVEVRRVLDAIGATLLTVVRAGADRPVRDVVIVEPGHEDEIRAGDLVLGVGVVGVDAARDLVATAARSRAAAVLLKPPYAAEPTVTEAAGTGGVTVAEVRRPVSWAQLVWLLRGVIDTAEPTRDSAAFHDLFALADAVAAVVDAPVTIEDAHNRVLAYSARQDRTDPARLSTIIGRHVPDDVLYQFRAKGVFRKLGKGTEPVFVPGQPDGTLPRLIVPVRLGGELLGSIWAIVPGPVPPERAQAFADTAAVVALHLLRLRAQADIARRATSDRLRAVLYAGEAAQAAAEELGLREGPYRVVALGVHAAERDAEGRRLALWESISRRHGWHRPLVAELEGVLLAVVSERGGPAESGTWAWLRRVVADVARDEPNLLVAAGGLARTPAELPASRAQAEEVLRLLAGGALRGPVVVYDDAWATLVLYRATGAVPLRELVSGGPLPALLAHDAEHGTRYVETLRAWLEQHGDPTAASRRLHIHPNTFRYRMRRLLEVAPIDLASPEVRLALSVQLTALRLHPGDVVPGEQRAAATSS